MSYYIENAPSPHDNKKMDAYLSHPTKEGFYRFGFNSTRDMITQCNLEDPIYYAQIKALFCAEEFSVKAYLVDALAYSETETLFRWSDAQLVEIASDFPQFLAMAPFEAKPSIFKTAATPEIEPEWPVFDSGNALSFAQV